MPLHWGLGFEHMNEGVHTNIPTVAIGEKRRVLCYLHVILFFTMYLCKMLRWHVTQLKSSVNIKLSCY